MTNNFNVQAPVKKSKSMPVRWRIFACFVAVTSAIMVILWLCQTVFFDAFYYSVKTHELKKSTKYVAQNIEQENILSVIDYLSGKTQMSIRVVDTGAFSDLYKSGESFGPVTYDIGAYEMFDLYTEAVENGGECTRFYEGKQDRNVTAFIDAPNGIRPDFFHESEYRQSTTPSLFFNNDKHDNLLYVRLEKTNTGSEIMVVGETRITPLDSTVSTLKYQLKTIIIIILILSLIASFFIARIISKPIEKINASAKSLARGNYDTRFDGRGYREIEQLNDTLNHTACELGKVEGLRRELMSNVSHDMRTPLTMITGYAEVMRDIPGENSPENLQVIIDEAKRLTDFVNNILDLTKLQNGIDNFEMTRENLTEMIRKLSLRYKMLYPENDGYIVQFNAQCDAYVLCDSVKMTQVVLNLIDNAINYTGGDKTVRVNLSCNNNTVRVEVCDSGEGIDENELPYIWDRYYKTKKSHKRSVTGSGIGLSIVKEILTRHNARFGVESKKGAGSTFWFELPAV